MNYRKSKKIYTSAPLPFQGQKRYFTKQFAEALRSFPPDATYVDLFGGSGLLSHTVKSVYPQAKVIYNDFDNFHQRLENIPKLNEILTQLRPILKDYPRGKKITGEPLKEVLTVLEKAQNKGFVDWVSLSSSLCFSGRFLTRWEDAQKGKFYNQITKDYPEASGYLSGIEVVKKDYKALFEQYKNAENVVFILDPPYLSTDVTTYNKGTYWRLTDYLEVLEILHGQSFFYFTSDKSQLPELMHWLSAKRGDLNPFAGATKIERISPINGQSQYKDIMYFKRVEKPAFART